MDLTDEERSSRQMQGACAQVVLAACSVSASNRLKPMATWMAGGGLT
jgi:hypothetical protein